MTGFLILWVCYQKYLIADKKTAPLRYGTRSVAHFRTTNRLDWISDSLKYCKCEEPYIDFEPDIYILEIKKDRTKELKP